MIQNFAKVDDVLWRGGCPDRDDAKWLVDSGIKTVINLEWEHDDNDAFADLAVTLVRLADFEIIPWFAASLADRHIVRFIIAMRKAVKPVYAHCRSGQNRTGVAVAAYRLLEKNDPLDTVLADFKSYRGFWAWGDSRYISTIPGRSADLLHKIDLGRTCKCT